MDPKTPQALQEPTSREEAIEMFKYRQWHILEINRNAAKGGNIEDSELSEDVANVLDAFDGIEKEDTAALSAEVDMFTYVYDNSDQPEYEDAEESTVEMLNVLKAQAIYDLVDALNPEARKNWDRLMETEPDPLQFGHTLNSVAKLTKNQTFDELYEEKVRETLDRFDLETKSIEEKVNLVTSLNNDQLEQVLKLSEMGYGEMANNLIMAYRNVKE